MLSEAGADIASSLGSQQNNDQFKGELQEGSHGRKSLSYPFI
jgi:hypothetical protein